jgi:hypothetical protein
MHSEKLAADAATSRLSPVLPLLMTGRRVLGPVARLLPLPNDPTLDEALVAFASDVEAHGDIHATAQYRCDLVRCLGLQTIEEAARCRV